MSIDIHEFDADGAVAESREEAIAALETGDTRLSFLRKAGVSGGAVLSGGAILGALTAETASAAGRPPGSFGKGDIGILNYALTLEYLEAAFYNQAAASGAITDPQLKAFLSVVQEDENAHVAYLKSALKSKAAKSPKFDFKGTTTNQDKFRATSMVLENTGVHAYSGQALNIKSPKVVKAALSILTIEARHASVIGFLNQSSAGIAPSGAFDTPLTAAKVLAAVKGTGFIVG